MSNTLKHEYRQEFDIDIDFIESQVKGYGVTHLDDEDYDILIKDIQEYLDGIDGPVKEIHKSIREYLRNTHWKLIRLEDYPMTRTT